MSVCCTADVYIKAALNPASRHGTRTMPLLYYNVVRRHFVVRVMLFNPLSNVVGHCSDAPLNRSDFPWHMVLAPASAATIMAMDWPHRCGMRQPAPKIGDPRRKAAHILSPGSTDPIECTGIAKPSFFGHEELLVFRRWRRAGFRHLPIQEPKIGVPSWPAACTWSMRNLRS